MLIITLIIIMGLIVSSKRWHLLLFIRSSNPNKGKTTRTKKTSLKSAATFHTIAWCFFLYFGADQREKKEKRNGFKGNENSKKNKYVHAHTNTQTLGKTNEKKELCCFSEKRKTTN